MPYSMPVIIRSSTKKKELGARRRLVTAHRNGGREWQTEGGTTRQPRGSWSSSLIVIDVQTVRVGKRTITDTASGRHGQPGRDRSAWKMSVGPGDHDIVRRSTVVRPIRLPGPWHQMGLRGGAGYRPSTGRPRDSAHHGSMGSVPGCVHTRSSVARLEVHELQQLADETGLDHTSRVKSTVPLSDPGHSASCEQDRVAPASSVVHAAANWRGTPLTSVTTTIVDRMGGERPRQPPRLLEGAGPVLESRRRGCTPGRALR